MEKLEFGSRAWTEELHRCFAAALANAGPEADGVDFSLCERYENPPAHLTNGDAPLGWHAHFKGGEVSFVYTPSQDVDVYILTEYDAVLPVAREVFGHSPEGTARQQEMVAKLAKSGGIKVTGDMSKRPAWLHEVHDHMAELTQ